MSWRCRCGKHSLWTLCPSRPVRNVVVILLTIALSQVAGFGLWWSLRAPVAASPGVVTTTDETGDAEVTLGGNEPGPVVIHGEDPSWGIDDSYVVLPETYASDCATHLESSWDGITWVAGDRGPRQRVWMKCANNPPITFTAKPANGVNVLGTEKSYTRSPEKSYK